MTKSVRRLYNELKPSHYVLKIVPDMKAMTFYGTVTINLRKTGRPSQRITFHQHELKIDSASIIKHDKKGNRELPIVRINSQNTLDEVRLHTLEMIYSGEYTVQMTFHGTITKTMTGLYPCYFTINGTEHVLLATQFESHYARELFPSIDEPEAKAIFDLTIQAPKHMTVLSNTPVLTEKSVNDDRTMLTTFETTPKMSTYLLAFVIGELQSTTAQTARGTDISIWTTPAHPIAALDYALNVAKRSVEFFETYFDIPYPLTKLDHVGLPDFTSGAMENWGLITYRERLLIAYPDETSQSAKEYIAMVVSHETSHQWFGNLVTMKWWDDLWLNESFANMMEYQAVDHMFPEWHIWETFIMSEGLSALRRDATRGVQAVKTTVRYPDEINTLFDGSIVYAKGGRLLYMLKTYIGEHAFRKGLTAYFKKHAYGNTTGADLWQTLTESSGQDVAALMNPWLEQSGFPVISVEQHDGQIHIIQQHFQEDGAVLDDRHWPVPLFETYPNMPKLLTKELTRVNNAKDQMPRINQESAGHYIVDYRSLEHRAAILDAVTKLTISAPDRLMLLNGASMLAKAGLHPFASVIEMLTAYEHEQSEPVWSMIALILAEIRRFVDLDEQLEPKIQSFVRSLTTEELARLGWEEKLGETVADNKQRATIISLSAYAKNPDTIEHSLTLFTTYRDKDVQIAPELRSIVMSVAVRQKLPGAFEWLLERHDVTQNGDLKADIMAALTSSKDPHEAEALLVRLTDIHLVKPQDADHWLFYLMRNRPTRALTWQWMTDNWGWVEETYAHDKSYDYFPRYAAGICNTVEWAKKYRAFFEPKRENITLRRNIDIGLNEIQTRVAWLERDIAGIQTFFNKP
jgi:aminopeptidase N